MLEAKKTMLTLVLLLLACGGAAEAPPNLEVAEPETWGSLAGVTHVSRLWFAGQPDRAALVAGKERGVSVVINLRDPAEHDWDEAMAAQDLGMSYYNVPVSGAEPFRAETFDRIEELVRSHDGEQVLIHCSSGNRAAAWLGYHLVGAHGMEPARALAMARKAGVTKDGVARNIEALVGSR